MVRRVAGNMRAPSVSSDSSDASDASQVSTWSLCRRRADERAAEQKKRDPKAVADALDILKAKREKARAAKTLQNQDREKKANGEDPEASRSENKSTKVSKPSSSQTNQAPKGIDHGLPGKTRPAVASHDDKVLKGALSQEPSSSRTIQAPKGIDHVLPGKARPAAASHDDKISKGALSQKPSSSRTIQAPKGIDHVLPGKARPAAASHDDKVAKAALSQETIEQAKKRKRAESSQRPGEAKRPKIDAKIDGKTPAANMATAPLKSMIHTKSNEARRKTGTEASPAANKLQKDSIAAKPGAVKSENPKKRKAVDEPLPKPSPDGQHSKSGRTCGSSDEAKADHQKEEHRSKRSRLLEQTQSQFRAFIKSGSTNAKTSGGAAKPSLKRPFPGREDDQQVKRPCTSDVRSMEKEAATNAATDPPKHQKIDGILPNSTSYVKNDSESPGTLSGEGRSPTITPTINSDKHPGEKATRKVSQPTGLYNSDHGCFLNSIVQLLYRVYLSSHDGRPPSEPPKADVFGISAASLKKLEKRPLTRPGRKVVEALRKEILDNNENGPNLNPTLTTTLLNLFEAMQDSEGEAVSPAVFQQLFAYMCSGDATNTSAPRTKHTKKRNEDTATLSGRQVFNGEVQQDAHEFYTKLIVDLGSEQESSLAAGNAGRGALGTSLKSASQTRIQCTDCDFSILSREVSSQHLDWELPGGSAPVDMDDFVKSLSGSEKLSDYKCDGCGKEGHCIKSNVVTKLPPQLIVRIQRVGYDLATSRSVKKMNPIKLPFGIVELVAGHRKHGYKLTGCIKHSGQETSEGHYFSFVKFGAIWNKVDDDKIAVVGQDDVQKETDGDLYILLFEKVEGVEEGGGC